MLLAADILATVTLSNTEAVGSTQAEGFDDLVRSATGSGQFLVEIDAFRGGSFQLITSDALGVLGDVVLGDGYSVDSETSVNTVSLTYSDLDWVGAPDDAEKPNAHYEGRVGRRFRMSAEFNITPEANPRIQRQLGSLYFENADQYLDVLFGLAVDGRPVKVLFGPTMPSAYSDFQGVFKGMGVAWKRSRLGIELALRDKRFSLERPLQEDTYLGTGGAEGTSDLTGKPLPIALGQLSNITPTLVDPVNLIYQFHDQEAQAVDAVYDRGLALTDSGTDVSGYANLVAESVSASQFATALDVGMFKLGSSPDGLITCDVRGEASSEYINTLDVIVLYLIKERAGVSNSEVYSSTFTGVSLSTGAVGYYVSSEDRPSYEQALDDLMNSAGSFWGTARDGRLRAGRLTAPEDRQPFDYLNISNVVEVTPAQDPLPRWRQFVGYDKNWTPQTTDLAGAVTDSRRQYLSQEARLVSSIDALVKTRHTEALSPDPLVTYYQLESSAQLLADDLMSLHKKDRQLLDVRLFRRGFLYDLGWVVHLTWPLLGLESGKNFIVVGRQDQGEHTTVRLWG